MGAFLLRKNRAIRSNLFAVQKVFPLLSLARLGTVAFFAICVAITGCSPKTGGEAAALVPAQAAQAADAGLRDTAMAILWQQQSGEYAALCYQAFNAGRAFVREAQAAEAGGRYAAVLDIDETVLDNSPYAAYLVHQNAPWSAESWEAWCNAAAAEAVPGALDFCRFLAENGIEIFYVSNRPDSTLSATTANLQALGFPNARADHVLLQTGTSDKTPRVNSVREQGYTVLLFAGDNLDDFDGSIRKHTNAARKDWAETNAATFGLHRIVLPNAAYGTFEAALVDGYYGKPPAERAAARLELLKSWK
jgi:5'-nucleotidase (lipoprotein e(P4) family)